MAILELKHLPNLRENDNSPNYYFTNQENLNITFSNSTINIIDSENEKFYHKNNLGLLLIIMIAFYILSYFLYYISKINMKKAKNNNSENVILNSKYNNMQNLSIANLIRGLSIVYIVIVFNKSDNDVVSIINFFLHIFPSLLYFSIYFSYVRFLIEKYYEIVAKKKDIFFNPTFQFFNVIIYVIFCIIFVSSISTGNYYSLIYLGNGLIFVLSLIVSLLYLYYGVRLANIYANGHNIEIKEKKFIHDRILFISIIFGFLFLARAILSFFVSIKSFNNIYPSFMDPNMWDFFTFLLNEFLPSLVIGFTRQRDDKNRYPEKFNLDSFDFNKNYQNFSGITKGDLEKEKEIQNDNDLNDPLLDKIDKFDKI